LIVGVIAFMYHGYETQRWHQLLIYIAYTLAAFSINAFGTRLLPLLAKAAFIWSICGLAITSIIALACASPNYQPGEFVYRKFINETGWPDGIAWLLDLL
jgi:choline transport protein